MPIRKPAVDVVTIGFGWTGAIMAQELTDAGLHVLALERGGWRDTYPDFAYPRIADELKYAVRKELAVAPVRDTITFRNKMAQTALPMRQLGSFLPGEHVGGAGVHWNGQTWRGLPTDFVCRSHHLARYGKAAFSADMTVQDHGVTYAELEPHYDRFEYLCGISGQAGNLNGAILPGGNPFEGPRARPYPTPPLKTCHAGYVFGKAATELGYHPFPQPAANLSQAYTNPLGVQQAPCTYCGFCERFGCYVYAKSSPQTTLLPVLMRKPNFELRTGATVLRINTTPDGKRATGVTYIDADGREIEQPAEMVLLTAYVLQNVKLLLVSGIGKPYDPIANTGVVGRNYAYQIMGAATAFFDDKIFNPFMGAGALGTLIDDFNGDNFDHAGLGFIGGGYMGVVLTGGRPILQTQVPEHTPNWGSAWKKAVKDNYLTSFNLMTHGSVMSYRDAYLDLDPTYKDPHGLPLLRMTFDFHDNEHRMSHYITERLGEIARAMGAKSVTVTHRSGSYSIVPYQTTHNTGGAVMGADPHTSVVNPYLQSWNVPNLFVLGASAFPQQLGYNPTGTVAALAYRCAEAIRARYLRAPGPLG